MITTRADGIKGANPTSRLIPINLVYDISSPLDVIFDGAYKYFETSMCDSMNENNTKAKII